MYRLPFGSCVRSVKDGDDRLTGIVEIGLTGEKYVRWSDGTRTADFGTISENDEYIAAHLRFHLDREWCEGSHGQGQNTRVGLV